MCACGKAQRISLWLDLFEWTESFLRNPADQCRGFSRRETCPMERIAVRGRQRDRCAHRFNPNHFPVVEGWRLASVRSASGRLYPREAASDSRREKVLRTRVGARWNYVGMAPCPASSWEATNCWEAKCSTADAWRAALHLRGSVVPSCLRARRTQLFSSMPNRIHSRICIANATSRSCRLSISESTAQRRPFGLASLRLRLCRSRLPFRARRHHAREAWRHWLGCRWRG